MSNTNARIGPKSVAVIDADDKFTSVLIAYLSSISINCTRYNSSESFLLDDKWNCYQIVILDPDLPGMDGMDLIALARRESDSGILVITSRAGPDAFVCAMSAGADMVLNKPVRFDQVYYSISAIWRRFHRKVSKDNPINWWTISENARLLTSPDGQEVKLSRSELRIISCLNEVGGGAVSRADLIARAGITVGGYERNLDAIMFRLRKKLSVYRDGDLLKTIHGFGYKLNEPLMDGELKQNC